MTWTAAAVAVAALLLPAGSRAANLEISPVLVDLSAGVPAATLTVKNGGTAPMRYQVAAFRWTEDRAGAPTLQPSDEFSIFPPLFQLAAGASRKVRVGAIVPPEARERAWRIVVEEIPDAVRADGPRVAIRTRFAIPAFLAPRQPEPKGEAALQFDGKRLALVIVNRGNVRLKQAGARVELLDAAQKKIGELEVDPWYALAGAERAVELRVPEGLCAAVRRVRASVEAVGKVELSASADYPDGLCRR